MQFPAAAPISNSLSRAPARAAESPKLSLPGAAPGRLANFHFWGRGRQVMHLPCKQVYAGALPADSTIFRESLSEHGDPNGHFRWRPKRPLELQCPVRAPMKSSGYSWHATGSHRHLCLPCRRPLRSGNAPSGWIDDGSLLPEVWNDCEV